MGLVDGQLVSPALERQERTRRSCVVVLIILGVLMVFLVMAFVARVIAFQTCTISSASMEPTYHRGAVVLINKWDLGIRHLAPARFDVVLFTKPQTRDVEYLKRIVGLPGETIQIKSDAVLINGKQITDGCFLEPPIHDFGPVTIGKSEYFLLGDNINHSSDSRVFGNIPRYCILGKAVLVLHEPR